MDDIDRMIRKESMKDILDLLGYLFVAIITLIAFVLMIKGIS